MIYKVAIFACLSLFFFRELTAQDSLFIEIDTVATESGTNGDILFRASDFIDIVSLQFSITWMPEVATFVSADEQELLGIAIGESQATNGQLRFSWFSPDGLATSVEDSTVILRLRLQAIGANGEQTPIRIGDLPLAIQVFRSEPGGNNQFEEIGLSSRTGLLRIEPNFNVAITTTAVDCHGANTGSIDWTTAIDSTLYTFTWTNAAGEELQPPLQNLSAGTYTLSVRDLGGKIVLQRTAEVEQPAEVLGFASINSSIAACLGQIEITGAGGTPPYSYTLGEEENTTGVFTGLSPGNYQLLVADANECRIAAAQEVRTPPAPQLSILGDSVRSFCGETMLELTASANEAVSYRWSNGDTLVSTTVSSEGNYTVVATSLSTGCQDTASVALIAGSDIQASLESPLFPICPNDTLTVRVAGGTSYTWLGDLPGLVGGSDSPLVELAPDTTQQYEVRVASDCGADTLRFEVTVFEVLATAGPDTCIAPNESIELYASGGLFYLWEENNNYPLSDLRTPNPAVSPLATTIYYVQIEDINGCLTNDEITVELAENPTENIRAINAITPNGDGMNDVLEFGSIAKYGTNTLKVYNRWGGLVYNKVNYQNDESRFDGTYMGQPLPEGTYYYTLEFATGIIKQSLFISR